MKKRKLNKKNLFLLIFFVLMFFTFIFSLIKIFIWVIDNKKTDKIIKVASNITEITETKSDNEVIIETSNKTNAYFEYIKMSLIDVDLDKLKRYNEDTVGWLKVEGTNINYPFVQTDNNEDYLTKSFDKTFNYAGWIFLDYRNSFLSLDRNTIIYGHGRVNGTMFGSLKDTLKPSWQSNEENYIIRMSTEKVKTMWQIFSTYKIPTTSDYIKTSFISDDEYMAFLETIKNRSEFNFNVDLNSDDKILTLSTCYNDTEKMVVHAKLIKYEIKA